VCGYLVLDPGAAATAAAAAPALLAAARALPAASLWRGAGVGAVVGGGGSGGGCLGGPVRAALAFVSMAALGVALRRGGLAVPYRTLEMPLAAVLAAMEARGVAVAPRTLAAAAAGAAARLVALEAAAAAAAAAGAAAAGGAPWAPAPGAATAAGGVRFEHGPALAALLYDTLVRCCRPRANHPHPAATHAPPARLRAGH